MRSRSLVLSTALALVACDNKQSIPDASSAALAPTSQAAPSSAGSHAADSIATSKCEAKIIPLQHATFVIQCGKDALYFDPVHDAKYDGLPKADLVFITDIHFDHLDPKGLDMVRQASTTFVAPPAVAEKLPKEITNVVVLKNGETKDVRGYEVEAVPMYNITRGPEKGQLFHDKGRGDGYVVTIGSTRVYDSGDTECTPEMKALKDIDVAFVCMNLPYTMPPSEAAECVNAFRPKKVYPFHYKGSDPNEFKKAITGNDVEVELRDWYPK